MSICPSVHLSVWNTSAPTGRIFVEFDIWIFSENLSRKFRFHKNLTITGTLLEVLKFVISRSIILRTRNVSDGSCVENQNTFFSHFSENRVVCEIMWKNMVWTGHRRECGACRVAKATDTHTRKICSTWLLFHGNDGYTNAPQCYVYMYIACPVWSMFIHFSLRLWKCLCCHWVCLNNRDVKLPRNKTQFEHYSFHSCLPFYFPEW